MASHTLRRYRTTANKRSSLFHNVITRNDGLYVIPRYSPTVAPGCSPTVERRADPVTGPSVAGSEPAARK